jgi:hypothetical protein
MFIISIMKSYLLIIFFIISNFIFGTNNPTIELFLPKKNYRSTKPIVLLKGKIKHADTLTINGHNINLYKSRFYQKAILNPHQENKFIFTAKNSAGKKEKIERIIEYFPEKTPRNPNFFTINYIYFDQKTNQWTIKGKAPKLKSIYINSIELPINSKKTFELRLTNQQHTNNSLDVSAITNDLLFLNQKIGLYQYADKTIDKKPFEKDTSKFEIIQKAILDSFKTKNWGQIPITTIQQKMITELITAENDNLHLSKIKLLKNKNFIVAILPSTHKNIDLKNTSFQFMHILQNTIPTAQTVSILWYNSVPNIIEIVYDNILSSDNYYWLINDIRISEDQLINKKIIKQFNEKSFI